MCVCIFFGGGGGGGGGVGAGFADGGAAAYYVSLINLVSVPSNGRNQVFHVLVVRFVLSHSSSDTF